MFNEISDRGDLDLDVPNAAVFLHLSISSVRRLEN
jgi:hypothetical protein